MHSLWLKNPLAVLADGDAGGGVVVAGNTIVELVPGGGGTHRSLRRSI